MSKQGSTRVLIVEDHDWNRTLLKQYVEMSGGTPVEASDGLEALDEIHAHKPDLVILDLLLPRIDGYSVLRRLRDNPDFSRLPIVIISAAAEIHNVSECIDLGAMDFLPKPFKPQVLQTRIRSYLHRCASYQKQEALNEPPLLPREYARQMIASLNLLQNATSRSSFRWPDALFEVLDRYTPETRRHLDRVGAYCRAIVEQLAKTTRAPHGITAEFINDFCQTANFHDIGKLAVPETILNKPGPLTPEEHRVMRRHVTVGAEILREMQRVFPQETRLKVGIDVALYHHERWDGFGYPFGLAGEHIPLAGRIMAIADVYDALTSERCYKRAYSHSQSRDIILASSGKQFDPAVVAAFLACEEAIASIAAHTGDEETTQAAATPHAPGPQLLRSNAMSA